MFKIRARAEDVLGIGGTLALAAYAGWRSALGRLAFSEEQYWNLSYLVAPASIIIFGYSVRYAFRSRDESESAVFRRIGLVVRDWFPFLLFLMTYEAFQSKVWETIHPRNLDGELLRWDRTLFGETPSVAMQGWITPALTRLLTSAYFLHLVLPPALALLLYLRNRAIFREFLMAVVLIGLLGSVGYTLVPAVGPAIAFPQLYTRALSGQWHGAIASFVDAARASRDCFPSLHTGISALVLFYGGRYRRWMFGLLALPVGGIWVSTLYLRYHYLVDVFAGWIVAALAIAAARLLIRRGSTSGAPRDVARPVEA